MLDSISLVRRAVAALLGTSPDTIEATDLLERDLELTKLDLVLIALRLESMTHSEFPIAKLESARTVADMADLLRSTRMRSDVRWRAVPEGRRLDTLPSLRDRRERIRRGA